MKKFIILLFACSFILPFSSCKKQQNMDTIQLQSLVEQINENNDTILPNGNILSACDYKEGDSLFIYHIKVNDNRYDNVDVDSIKSSINKELKSEGMKKITNLLRKNNIGLKYSYETSSKEIDIVFSPEEL